ncbi:WhiB family transcriptional regulator [Nocardioides sp. TRM66260-LWL]|uniref:WhiB family transcriptional regulator n=1 Tax=Nocardioides sp. TRM66260-LWL TaxID=2874478 RepID=UPI001CC65AD9|nr:WhiB family transcriptional regulator [Nocardioides sp. TRM66260-LWL]MBZ5735124.1 WhiB family transcriptional regulator [Nocardioides sp. TRM66260-LWL]
MPSANHDGSPRTGELELGAYGARNLDGAACLELNPLVAHKFFDINFQRDVVRRKAAQNICARCVVAPECLQNALHGPAPPTRGVIAGLSAHEVRRARSWLAFETGALEKAPRRPRPQWLPRPDAAETTEQTLVELDEGIER